MDWHINVEQLRAAGEQDKSGSHTLGWSGYTWNKFLFPDPEQFLAKLHDDHLKTSLNLHPASGIQPWESQYPAMAKAMGIDPATRQYVPFDITDKKFADQLLQPRPPSAREAGHRLLVARLAAGTQHEDGRRDADLVAQLRPLH